MPRAFIPIIPEVPVGMTQSRGEYADFLNGYFDSFDGSQSKSRKLFFSRRPWAVPVNTQVTALSNLTGLGAGFGTPSDTTVTNVVSSLDNTKLIISVYNNTAAGAAAWYYDASTNTLTSRATPASWGSVNYFTRLDGISYGANVFYAATDFTRGAVIDSSGNWTAISDADYTGLGTKTNFVGMDGYLFFGVTSGTGAGRLYNTDLGAATSVTSTSYLTPADYPGAIMWLGRIRNYIIVFKQYSIEFFENVGNPTPGSPLEAQKQLTRRIGLFSPGSVQEVSDGIIFFGINEKGKIQAYKIFAASLEIKEISTPEIEFGLMNEIIPATYFSTYASSYSSGTWQVASQVLNWKNKELYIVTMPSADPDVTDIVSYVYDNELNIWTRWNGVSDPFFPGFMATSISCSGYRGPLLVYNRNVGTGGSNAAGFFNALIPDLTYSTALATGEFSTTTKHTFRIKTDFLDLGNNGPKFLDQFMVYYDSNENLSAGTTSTMTMTYNDGSSSSSNKDKTYYTTSPKEPRVVWRRLGYFYRRSFTVSLADQYFVRFGGFELVYNVGEQDQDG